MESAGSYLVVRWVANKREVNKKTQYLVRNPPLGARSQHPSSPRGPGIGHTSDIYSTWRFYFAQRHASEWKRRNIRSYNSKSTNQQYRSILMSLDIKCVR